MVKKKTRKIGICEGKLRHGTLVKRFVEIVVHFSFSPHPSTCVREEACTLLVNKQTLVCNLSYLIAVVKDNELSEE